MHVTWHGQYTVKLVSGETTLVLDPHSGFRAKAQLVSLTHPTNIEMSNVAGVAGEPRVINSPGEYSVAGMTAHAMGWHDGAGHERSVQRWDIEQMVVLALGALDRELTDEELSELERTEIDILFLPVDNSTLPLKIALDIVTKIEPRVLIPINFTNLKQFAQEMGVTATAAQPKFLAKASKLPTEDMETIILSV
jgi:L-ascorbate metabolism protein UlaG (beta-lactamase superfamily)